MSTWATIKDASLHGHMSLYVYSSMRIHMRAIIIIAMRSLLNNTCVCVKIALLDCTR